MADKTTTLKTKTNDNVYPNVIGDNRKNAFVDSSTITHHFYDKTHKVGFQIANETNIKIQNSLQKPAGLTKTKLVGVGTNGQENIEIGDNLTLANGKLSATGGGSGGVVFDTIVLSSDETTYTGTITGERPILIESNGTIMLPVQSYNSNICLAFSYEISFDSNDMYLVFYFLGDGTVQYSKIKISSQYYSHFITLTSSSLGSINFNYINTSSDKFTIDSLKTALAGKYVTCSGYIDDGGTKEIAQYIAGEAGGLNIGWFDSSDGSTGGTQVDNTFSISDDVSQVE